MRDPAFHPIRGRIAGAVVCLLVLVCAVACAPAKRGGADARPAAAGSPARAAVEALPGDDDSGGTPAVRSVPLTDDNGRTLILRGANFMGIEFGWFGHQPEDFRRMASWGFNLVRLPIAWALLERTPGVYDEAYLDTVSTVVGWAADAGLHVLVDMHQWQWSPCSQGNGIPAWTCADLPLDIPLPFVWQAQLFWDRPEYLDAFVAAWEHVAARFDHDPRIWGFDLFNEPEAGAHTVPWIFDDGMLRPLYVRFIAAIRDHHPDARLLVEPSLFHNAGMAFAMDAIPGDLIVYAPHVYPGLSASGGPYDFPRSAIEDEVRRDRDEADARGWPMLVGEYGISSGVAGAESFARDAAEVLDAANAGSAWWGYWRDDGSMGLLDAAGNEKEIFLRHVSRPYPRMTAGTLESYQFDVDEGTFGVRFATIPGMAPAVEIFLPFERHYPDGFEVSSTDTEGAWSWAFDDATGVLAVTCDPGAAEHVVTVTRAER